MFPRLLRSETWSENFPDEHFHRRDAGLPFFPEQRDAADDASPFCRVIRSHGRDSTLLEDLADGIRQLLQDEKLTSQLSGEAQRREFRTWEDYMKNFLAHVRATNAEKTFRESTLPFVDEKA